MLLPESITKFIESNHVVSIATLDSNGLWSASCFYAFDARKARLLLLSSAKTRHGAAMLGTPSVCGTISAQTRTIRDIRGIQFSASAEQLDQQDRREALALYTKRHPLAKLKTTDVWELRLQLIKFTDNSHVFGHKTLWTRAEADRADF